MIDRRSCLCLTLSLRLFSSRLWTYLTAASIPGASRWWTTSLLRNSAQWPNGLSKAAIDWNNTAPTYTGGQFTGIRASMNPRFEAEFQILSWKESQILWKFSTHYHVVVVHRKIHWRIPKLKSLNSMPVTVTLTVIQTGSQKPVCSHSHQSISF